MVNALFILFLIVFGFIFFYVSTKNTYLFLNFKTGNVWSFLIYRELLMVFSALLLVLVYGLDVFDRSILNARSEDVFYISLLTVYAVFAFLATLSVMAKLIKVPVMSVASARMVDDAKIRRFANAAILAGMGLLGIAMIFLGFQHAFITAIISGGDLLVVRLQNTYSSGLPSQLKQVINVAWWIVSIYVGFLVYKKHFVQSFIYGLAGIFLASAPGDKAPVIMFFMMVGFSFSSLRGLNLSPRFVFKSVFFYFPVLYFLLFGVVSLQIPDLDFEVFNIYLLNRLGVGQMSGVFETFSIPRLGDDFFWHMIPGASFFVSYIPYDKALMMATEGYGLTEMGVKNSFFISEAYGIGGIWLVFISPVIVGVSYSLGVFLLSNFLRYFFGDSISLVYAFPLYILSSALTGGFSSFPLFKGLLLEIACLGLIWFCFQFLRITFIKDKKKQS